LGKISSQGYINEIQINRVAFVQQNSSSIIILWMVVFITLAGVGLAGIQLFASYKIADNNRSGLGDAGEISIGRDRIVLRSSIIGLFILVISFAFFLAFILYVYRLEQPEARRGALDHVERLEPGGLGSPPP
jgi:hypothetical protein